MSRREKILLALLVFVCIGTAGLVRAANPAVRVNGIDFTWLASDVCPSGSKTCLRADSVGKLIQKKSSITTYVVAVSPQPSPALDGQCVVYDSTNQGGFKNAACGGAGSDGLLGVYQAASSTTQNIVVATAADGTPTFRDNAGDNLVGFQAQDSSGTFDLLKTTNDDGSGTVLIGYGPWANTTAILTGTIRTEDTAAATGGTPIRSSPSMFFGGRCYDGSTSRTCGGLIVSKSETSGASYTGELDIYCRRNVTDTLCGTFTTNGTDTGLVTPKIGTTAATLHAFPTGTGDVCSIDATQTLTNKTLTSPVLGSTVTGTYTIGGTPTLGAVLTTNAFVGPNYGGTSTNTPTVTWTSVSGGIGFSNSWVDFGGATAPARYMKDASGRVYLSGTVKSGTVPSVAFTLPAGYRPSHTLYWGDASTNREIDVATSGAVNLNMGTNVAVTLDGVSFFAAN